jgi:hypothetical protein
MKHADATRLHARNAHGQRAKKERYEDDCEANHNVAAARDCRLQHQLSIVAPTLPENVHCRVVMPCR